MVRSVSVILSVVAILACAAPVAAQNQGTWLDKNSAALVVPFQSRHGAAGTNGRVYFFGGVLFPTATGTFTRQTRAYDPVTNAITNMSDMPGNREWFSTAQVNVGGTNYIYVLGGTINQVVTALAPVFRFDPALGAAGTWTSFPGIPTARYRCSAVADNNLIRVLGGITAAGSSLNTHEIYDANTNTWSGTPGSAMPRNIANPYVGAINGKVVVAGGIIFPGGTGSAQIDELDSASGTWIPATGFIDVAPSDGGSAVYSNRLFMVSGGVGGVASGLLREYHSATRIITLRPSCTSAAFWGPAALLNNKIYTIGGELVATERLHEYTPPLYGPNLPTAAYQKSVNGPQVPSGGSVGATVVFGANITDPDTIDTVRIEVEVRAFPGGTFVGVPTGVGAMRPQSGAPVEVVHPPLLNGAYMWKYRAVDPFGDATAWQDFGLPADMDFVVNQAIVFDNEDNAAGDGPGPGCSAGSTVNSLGMLLGLAVMAFGLRRRK